MIYVDHHPFPAGFTARELPGVQLVHEVDSCSSELVYRAFQGRLPHEALFLAVYGAIADCMERTPLIAAQLEMWDRRLLFVEAGLLSEALLERRDNEFRSFLVHELAQGKHPSEIPEVLAEAVKGLRHEYEVIDYTRKYVEKRGSLAIVSQLPVKGFGGKAAAYAIAFTGAKVGVAVSLRNDRAHLSLRSRDPALDLNQALRKLTIMMGGHGGGHPMAAGGEVPAERLQEFLDLIDAYLRT
ncbi:MAG: DHH family phosphoesterase [Candidatus Bathyarchaeia archaeon]